MITDFQANALNRATADLMVDYLPTEPPTSPNDEDQAESKRLSIFLPGSAPDLTCKEDTNTDLSASAMSIVEQKLRAFERFHLILDSMAPDFSPIFLFIGLCCSADQWSRNQ
ncbi:hypothetical protein PoB_001523300 [Plakobranchus ocellatus]|uniref:Uncharacterized protein n=1 Tax=Plakobranchus ocellatus TaxID=259542 RepID=A0AAV3Z1T1_9GAST|nr:hypothetical protein PoB_001523300 [Plakobranchus ocellatus]